MKIIKYIILGLTFVTFSCEDFLIEEPKDRLTGDQFYQTERDFRTALTSVYSNLYGIENRIGLLTSVDSDESQQGNFGSGEIDDFEEHTYSAANGAFEGWWNINYNGINEANAIIDKGPGVSLPEDDAELVERYVAEAKFLRAYFYFNLVLAYGDVPLLTKPTTGLEGLSVERSPAVSVYAQIEIDLQEAESVLPEEYSDIDDVGRPTRWTASAMLAKTYLFQDKFTQARDKAQEVMNSGMYSLYPDFLDATNNTGKNGPEHIFSVQFARGLKESNHGRLMGISARDALDKPDEIGGQSQYGVEQEFYDEFPEGYRKEVSFISRFVPAKDTSLGLIDVNFPHCAKYYDASKPGAESSNNDNNFNVIRYADVMLIFAEAENEVNNGPTAAAELALNQIRRRAYANGADITQPEPAVDVATGLSQSAFRDLVHDERKWELAFEGHRRWDLIRTGKYLDEVVFAKPENVLFPIPRGQLDVNEKLTQNTGY